MAAKTFQGKMYIAPQYAAGVKGFTNGTNYSSSKWSITGVDACIEVIAASGKTVPISSTLTIEEKSSNQFIDGLTNKKSTMNEVSGKITIEAEIFVYDAIKKAFNGVKSEIRLVDANNMQCIQLMNVIPYFAETTKFGETQSAEITFTYRQGATVSNTLRRFRIVDILPVV